MTSDCANKLKLPFSSSNACVTGFGNTNLNMIVGKTSFALRPRNSMKYEYNLSVFIVDRISGPLPKNPLPSYLLSQFSDLYLADPNCLTPGSIDLLIEADLYFRLLTGKIRSHTNPLPIETTLGWIISGSMSTRAEPVSSYQFVFHSV